MADCRNCRHPYCSYVGVDRGGLVECANYLHPLKPTKPITNADRIRAMSDEELGRFLETVENRRSAAGGGAIWKGAAHAIDWLKQPAEEVDDDTT